MREGKNKKEDALFRSFLDILEVIDATYFDCYNMRQQTANSDKIQQILLELNKTGLSYLKYLQFHQAVNFFKKAEKIVNRELLISTNNQKINQLAGVTFNNLACYYKKIKRPKVALSYLQKSLQIQVYKINDWVSTGSTYLNICAIYSYLNRHQQALSHAKLAAELLDKKTYSQIDMSQEAKSYWNIKMLCYYNKAIQEQHLKMNQVSLKSYLRAKDIAKLLGAKSVGIIVNCDQAIARLENLLANLKKKMLEILIKKKQNEQNGNCYYMRRHKTNNDDRLLIQEKIAILSAFQAHHVKKKFSKSTKNKGKEEIFQTIRKRHNSMKYKSLNEYMSMKYRIETQSAI